MTNKLITAYFEADHDRLDALLRGFQRLKRQDFPAAKPYFRNFLRGLKRHIVWEEEVLFPLFESKSGMPAGSGPTQVMRMEHRQIGEALEKIHDKVRVQDPESDAEEAVLLAVLGQHNAKEESILYPGIDRLISEQDAADAFRAMEEIPEEKYMSCCGTHGHEKVTLRS